MVALFPVCLAEHGTVMVEARAWGSEILKPQNGSFLRENRDDQQTIRISLEFWVAGYSHSTRSQYPIIKATDQIP